MVTSAPAGSPESAIRRGTSIRSMAGLIVKAAGMAASLTWPYLALLTCIATVRSLCQGTTFRSGRLAQMFL